MFEDDVSENFSGCILPVFQVCLLDDPVIYEFLDFGEDKVLHLSAIEKSSNVYLVDLHIWSILTVLIIIWL